MKNGFNQIHLAMHLNVKLGGERPDPVRQCLNTISTGLMNHLVFVLYDLSGLNGLVGSDCSRLVKPRISCNRV